MALIYFHTLFILKRWNIKVYNIDFLIAILDYVLTFIDLDLKLTYSYNLP
jgi:hypothetical protein